MLYTIIEKSAFFLMITLVAALSLKCEKSTGPDGSDDEGRKTLALSLATGESQYFGTSFLDSRVENGGDFFEHEPTCGAVRYGNWLFILEQMEGGSIYRYTMDESNSLTGPKKLSFGAGAGPCNIIVVSSTKAYVCLFYLGKIAVINPTTMKKNGTIDLSSYATEADGSPEPSAAIIRDGLLYVALAQQATNSTAYDTAGCVAIIDIENDALEKIISDDRANSFGGFDNNYCTFTDENNNIYFYSNAAYGWQPELNDGILRIKDGETEFDPDYYFSIRDAQIEDVPGNMGLYGITFCYAGNGILYTSLQIPELTSDPPDYVNDRNSQLVKVDIVNKTITKLPFDPTNGYCFSALCLEDDGQLLCTQHMQDGSAGVFRYDPSSGNVTTDPLLTIKGNPYFLFPLGE